MENSLLIKDGDVLTGEGVRKQDILVVEGKITAMGMNLDAYMEKNLNYRVIDASGLLVLPGMIDCHTHILLDTGVFKTDDDWFVGTRTAAFGGVTTVVDFATQFKGSQKSFAEAVEDRLAEAKCACIDYTFRTMVTDLPPSDNDLCLQLRDMANKGVSSIKTYTCYDPNYFLDDFSLLRLLRCCKKENILFSIHCESNSITKEATSELVRAGNTGLKFHAKARPMVAEHEAVNRVALLAEAADSSLYVVHCSTSKSVEILSDCRTKIKGKSRTIIAETCPQYLLLDDSEYEKEHPEWYILQPPLRPPGEKQKLWESVQAGNVATIGTDHCDFALEKKTKTMQFPSTAGGLPGMQLMLPLLYTAGVKEGRISLQDLVRLCSTNAAKIFGMFPRKGSLSIGADADIVLFDPKCTFVVSAEDQKTITRFTPYEGKEITGRVMMTISRGRVLVDMHSTGDVRWNESAKGGGEFVKQAPFKADCLD